MITRYLQKRDNPWELLLLAFVIFFPGLILLLQTRPALLISGGRAFSRVTVLSPFAAHFFGVVVIIFSLFLVAAYVYALRSGAADEQSPPPHFLGLGMRSATGLLPTHKLIFDPPANKQVHAIPRAEKSVANNKVHLATFGFIGRHAIDMLSGVYLAFVIARDVGKFFPSLRAVTFIVLSVCWILTSIAIIMREVQGDHESLMALGIATLPPVIVGSAVVVLLARIVAQYEPAQAAHGFSILILEWGLIFWIGGYLVVLRDAYHKKKLDEDLAKKPDIAKEFSNRAL